MSAYTPSLIIHEDDPDSLVMIDVSSDFKYVVITASRGQERHTPAYALKYAKRIRVEHGYDGGDLVAEAIECAARRCLSEKKMTKVFVN